MHFYQNNLLADRKDLALKETVLTDFMHTDKYAEMSPVDQGLVMVQLVAIQNLMATLDRRIERF